MVECGCCSRGGCRRGSTVELEVKWRVHLAAGWRSHLQGITKWVRWVPLER